MRPQSGPTYVFNQRSGILLGSKPIKKEVAMRSLIQKSLIPTSLVMASLLLGGNAMAATAHVKAKAAPPAASRPIVDVAAIPPYPNYTPEAAPRAVTGRSFDAASGAPYRYYAPQYPSAGARIDVGQLVGAMLGMLPPQYAGIVQSAMRQSASHRSSGTYDPSMDSPTYDTSTPIDNSASDAAAAAAAAASAQDLADSMAMTASMAAAEQENDAANAAALQTEINAGM
jgi:hypothetical protein